MKEIWKVLNLGQKPLEDSDDFVDNNDEKTSFDSKEDKSICELCEDAGHIKEDCVFNPTSKLFRKMHKSYYLAKIQMIGEKEVKPIKGEISMHEEMEPIPCKPALIKIGEIVEIKEVNDTINQIKQDEDKELVMCNQFWTVGCLVKGCIAQQYRNKDGSWIKSTPYYMKPKNNFWDEETSDEESEDEEIKVESIPLKLPLPELEVQVPLVLVVEDHILPTAGNKVIPSAASKNESSFKLFSKVGAIMSKRTHSLLPENFIYDPITLISSEPSSLSREKETVTESIFGPNKPSNVKMDRSGWDRQKEGEVLIIEEIKSIDEDETGTFNQFITIDYEPRLPNEKPICTQCGSVGHIMRECAFNPESESFRKLKALQDVYDQSALTRNEQDGLSREREAVFLSVSFPESSHKEMYRSGSDRLKEGEVVTSTGVNLIPEIEASSKEIIPRTMKEINYFFSLLFLMQIAVIQKSKEAQLNQGIIQILERIHENNLIFHDAPFVPPDQMTGENSSWSVRRVSFSLLSLLWWLRKLHLAMMVMKGSVRFAECLQLLLTIIMINQSSFFESFRMLKKEKNAFESGQIENSGFSVPSKTEKKQPLIVSKWPDEDQINLAHDGTLLNQNTIFLAEEKVVKFRPKEFFLGCLTLFLLLLQSKSKVRLKNPEGSTNHDNEEIVLLHRSLFKSTDQPKQSTLKEMTHNLFKSWTRVLILLSQLRLTGVCHLNSDQSMTRIA